MLAKASSSLILLIATLMSCQRPLSAGKFPPNLKILRLYRKNINENPCVFGIVHVKDSTGIHQWPGNFVKVDDKMPVSAGIDGSYLFPLKAGRHYICAFQIGYSKVEIKKLIVKAGDSVRVDFYLHDNKEGIY